MFLFHRAFISFWVFVTCLQRLLISHSWISHNMNTIVFNIFILFFLLRKVDESEFVERKRDSVSCLFVPSFYNTIQHYQILLSTSSVHN